MNCRTLCPSLAAVNVEQLGHVDYLPMEISRSGLPSRTRPTGGTYSRIARATLRFDQPRLLQDYSHLLLFL
jgi:hypothetical protein